MRRTAIDSGRALAVIVLGASRALPEARREGEHAFGNGTDFYGGEFHFTAHGTDADDAAHGHVTYVYPSGRRFAGEVTCLRIVGDLATISGVLTERQPGGGRRLGVHPST